MRVPVIFIERQSFPTEVHMRLRDKIAIVVGAGQSPGEGLGNGRATVLRFVQEGAKVRLAENLQNVTPVTEPPSRFWQPHHEEGRLP